MVPNHYGRNMYKKEDIRPTEQPCAPSMLNYSALYDALCNYDERFAHDLYQQILINPSDTQQSLDYFFISQRHQMTERGTHHQSQNIQILTHIANHLGYQRFVLYMFLGKYIGNILEAPSQTTEKFKAEFTNLYQMLELFSTNITPDNSFQPTLQPLSSATKALTNLSCSIPEPVIQQLISKQTVTPMTPKNHIGTIQQFIPSKWAQELAEQTKYLTFYRKDHSVKHLYDYDIDSGPLIFILEELLNSRPITKIVAQICGQLSTLYQL